MRDEVIDLILRRLGQQIDDAKFDFMDSEGEGLWATWLSAPCRTIYLNVMHLQLRKFAILTFDGASEVYSITSERLCEFIAGFGCRKGNQLIQNLSLDIPFDSEPWIKHHWTPDFEITDEHWCNLPSTKHSALDFARRVHEPLLRTLDSTDEYCFDCTFRNAVFEQIGTIDMNMDGTPLHSLDLGQILMELPRNEEWIEAPLRRLEFFDWKRTVEQKRKTAGFEVMSPSIQEHE